MTLFLAPPYAVILQLTHLYIVYYKHRFIIIALCSCLFNEIGVTN